MIYGRYKKIRNNVWQIIIDYNINYLPLKVSSLANKMKIKLLSYEKGQDIITKYKLEKECEENEGFALLLPSGKWIILLDFTVKPVQRLRFTSAHELGHILLGHSIKAKYNEHIKVLLARGVKRNNNKIESEADMFAIRLLAPSCVIWGLNIHNSKDIAKLCDISYEAAQYKLERMKTLYKKNLFLSHPLEKQVYAQFKPFLEKYKKHNKF